MTAHLQEKPTPIDCKRRQAATAANFKLLASNWPAGVAIITAADRFGRLYGLTMTAVTSLSLDPMQFLICVTEGSATLPAMLSSGRFAIHILGRDQTALATRFAMKIENKFQDIPYSLTDHGVPIIEGCVGAVECCIASDLPGGDHRIIIGDVTNIIVGDGDPLIYHRGGFAKLQLI